MIQRIQTIFLLLVCILMTGTVFSPLLTIYTSGSSDLLNLTSWGVFSEILTYETWGVVSVAALSALVAFINIFLYKNRKLQIKIGNLTSFLLIFFYVTFATYVYFLLDKHQIAFNSVQYGIILPFIALIFNILAILKIKKDEKLVRSLDRIR